MFVEEIYPIEVIQSVFENWEDLNELKTYRPTPLDPVLQIEHVASLSEGETLLTHTKPNHPRKNSYEFVENLCCITADLDRARSHLTEDEDFALRIAASNQIWAARKAASEGYDTNAEFNLSEEMIELADQAITKVYYFLNYGPYYMYE